MPWRGHKRPTCKICGRPRQEGELFSARGKCPDCGNGRMLTQTGEMRDHSGVYFQEWRRQVAKSVGAVVLDDLQRDE